MIKEFLEKYKAQLEGVAPIEEKKEEKKVEKKKR